MIDFPQAMNAARNQNARKILLRDVDNLYRFVERFNPAQPKKLYAEEMWRLYERGELTPTTALTGHYAPAARVVNTRAVLGVVAEARKDAAMRGPRRRRRRRDG